VANTSSSSETVRRGIFRGGEPRGAAATQGEERAAARAHKRRPAKHGRPSRGVRTARAVALGAPPGTGRGLRHPATQPVCGAPPSLVGRKDLPLEGVTLTFIERNAMRAGRPDAARQSPRGGRPAMCGVRKSIRHAASAYSWMSPPRRSRRWR
jgi:hypothetical protein